MSLDDAFSLTRAEINLGTIEAEWVMGAAVPSDVIRATVAPLFFLSNRVVDILRENSFSGWETYAIFLRGKDGEQLPGFCGLAVEGRCGPIDNSRSEKFEKEMPGGVRSWWKGLFFDPESWDGADIFVSSGRGAQIFVVGNVKRALENARVKNIEFTSLTAFERMKLL